MGTRNMGRVSIISFSHINRNARVLRQVEYISKHYVTTVIGHGSLDPPIGTHVKMHSIDVPAASWVRKARTLNLLSLGRILPLWAYGRWYWGRQEYKVALALTLESKPDVIHANDWQSIPLAGRVSERIGARVILDLAEYSPLEREEQWRWRTLYKPMIDHFLKTLAPSASASVTVNQALAERYEKEYGLRPIVVMNTPRHEGVSTFKPTDPEHIRLIHHGGAMRNRRLELLIHAIAQAGKRYSLHFMLVEHSPGYVSHLKALAQRLAPGRVVFHQPVRPTEIVNRLTEFDMGIFLLPFTNYNYSVALPNKFFDFITAGLGVCIGPSPEMARLTRQYGFGVVASSFEPSEAAQVLNNLSAAEIDQMKKRALEAAKNFNADTELGKLIALYDEVLK